MVHLRKRASKVSYSKTYSFGSDEEQGPSTSKKRGYETDGSESAFSAGSQVNEPSEESEPISDNADGESPETDPEAQPASGSDLEVEHSPGKKKASNHSYGTPQKGTGLQTLLAPQRHPIYLRSEPTTRLTRQPSLFQNDATVGVLKQREDTADWWTDVVGPGPLWKFVEDKAWFKESASTTEDTHVQAQPSLNDRYCLRSRVYSSVTISLGDVNILTLQEAAIYLPNSSLSAPDSQICCYLGPFGNQNPRQLAMFDSAKISEHFDFNNKSHVFNAGAPIWALDWCPANDPEQKRQYLAVGPCSSRNFKMPLGTRVTSQSPACIQIWSLHPSEGPSPEIAAEDSGAVDCEMVLCVDCGPVLCLKWCPLPSDDPEQEGGSSSTRLRKLGILGGVFADGSLQFFAVPNPEDLRQTDAYTALDPSAGSLPVFVRLNKTLLRIELEESPIWSFDWANGETVAVGTTGGTVLVYHIKDHIFSQVTDTLLPSFAKPVHQSGIRSLSWVRAPPSDSLGRFMPTEDPTMICSVGYDGEIFMTDTRDQSSTSMGRYRDVINTVTFSSWAGGCIIPESDSVKWFNYSPAAFGRGRHIFSTTGPIWDVATSDFHPFVAVAASDGALRISNMLRVSRKGYSTPKFIYKIYQMEYNKRTGEYRMLERFYATGPDHLRASQPQPAPANKGKKQKKATEQEAESKSSSSSSWPPEAGILCASWNPNGLTKCQLLASATASGLCRIDNLWSLGRENKRGPAGMGKGKEKGRGEEMEVDDE
ncbi:hypothetical protein M407DRAFT_17857 [Tulasnella calospora MUT 4182]|uniref:Uncharacterized protein n=1 Tax=Tulasnella calospora MUT 4182 TaxID=1051891 RepID=A0A0C3LH58_9AGAM|nr:hypothetical protein M407DRAFT_17857 [Tulasnella calospora MUT 4182]